MDDDNIIPYQTSPTLTVKQAVMHMLGYRGEYYYVIGTDEFEFDLSDYLLNLQEKADSASGNASFELEMLKRNGDASPEEIKISEEKVASAKAELDNANKLPEHAEEYRQLLDRLVQLTRLGKRTHLSIDQDTSQRKGETHIYADSFYKWYDHYKQDPDLETSNAHGMPFDEEAFTQDMSGKDAENLYITLGLLILQLVESGGGKYGENGDPNVSTISKNLADRAYDMWGGEEYRKAEGRKPRTAPSMGKKSISNRIDLALAALKAAY